MSFNGMEKFAPGTMPLMEKTVITDGSGCYTWRETYVLWPHRSISGKRLWLCKAFKRKVWIVWGTGFHMEPEIQYGTIFDVIQSGSP